MLPPISLFLHTPRPHQAPPAHTPEERQADIDMCVSLIEMQQHYDRQDARFNRILGLLAILLAVVAAALIL